MKSLTVNDIKNIVETEGTASMNNLYVVTGFETETSRMEYFRFTACDLIMSYPTLNGGEEFSLDRLIDTTLFEDVFDTEPDAIAYANEVTKNDGYYTEVMTLQEFIQEIIYTIDDIISEYENVNKRLEYCKQYSL